jgi:hypothetical protein
MIYSSLNEESEEVIPATEEEECQEEECPVEEWPSTLDVK